MVLQNPHPPLKLLIHPHPPNPALVNPPAQTPLHLHPLIPLRLHHHLRHLHPTLPQTEVTITKIRCWIYRVWRDYSKLDRRVGEKVLCWVAEEHAYTTNWVETNNIITKRSLRHHRRVTVNSALRKHPTLNLRRDTKLILHLHKEVSQPPIIQQPLHQLAQVKEVQYPTKENRHSWEVYREWGYVP